MVKLAPLLRNLQARLQIEAGQTMAEYGIWLP
jgi:hypothetical protein